METVAKLTKEERNELFRATADKKGVTEALIEKDFWVCLLLKTIFENSELKELLIFKGGTSLSKCYNLINRFSEDVDLILDWKCLGISDEEAWKNRTATQQDKFNNEIDALGITYISESILSLLDKTLKEKIGNLVSLEIDKKERNIINVNYQSSFSDKYLLDYIKLEIGPRASLMPQNAISICSYAGEEYPDLFQMITSTVKAKALADTDLLKHVTDFKIKFYRSPSAKYDLAKPGTFKLLPSDRKWRLLNDDYNSMKEMIFGTIPEFSEIKSALKKLEQEINEL